MPILITQSVTNSPGSVENKIEKHLGMPARLAYIYG